MAQELIQELKQEQKLQQRLSAQQMLQVRLLEMPLPKLEESINTELDDNPALEAMQPDDALSDSHDAQPDDEAYETFEQQSEREEREDALDNALSNIGRDDEMPQNYSAGNYQNAEYEEMVYGDTVSFFMAISIKNFF